jgi:hypothetical protein
MGDIGRAVLLQEGDEIQQRLVGTVHFEAQITPHGQIFSNSFS